MNDNEFKAAFRQLDRVEPSAAFMQAVRSIPLTHPRGSDLPLWRALVAPSRWMAIAASAVFGLGVGYLTLDQTPESDETELDAFLALDSDEPLFTTSVEEDWDSP